METSHKRIFIPTNEAELTLCLFTSIPSLIEWSTVELKKKGLHTSAGMLITIYVYIYESSKSRMKTDDVWYS